MTEYLQKFMAGEPAEYVPGKKLLDMAGRFIDCTRTQSAKLICLETNMQY